MKPVSRYFDRIVTPSQLLTALPRAISVLTDSAQCGPVTLALPQDVQAEAYDYPEAFFAPTLVRIRAPAADPAELDVAAQLLRAAKQPVIVAGGGVLYSDRRRRGVARVCRAHRVPVAETQAGKSSLPWDHPLQLGPVGVTGSTAPTPSRATRIWCSPSARVSRTSRPGPTRCSRRRRSSQ
jgi:3D-(3,5/4)-trihydroxycyclohexane-1,2-dione acylhydrolase (decyclizing)